MKIKSILATICLLSVNSLVNAQNPGSVEKATPTGYTSLNLGMGVPLGDFSNEYVGAASPGVCFNINFSTPLFKSHLGITTKVDLSAFEMSTEPFIEQQKSVLNSSGLALQDNVDYKFKTVSYGSYSQTNCLTGLYFTAPMKRFSIDTRALAGINFTNRPESSIYFDFIAGNYTATYYEKAANSTSFAYDIGFSVRYNVGKKQRLCMMLSFDFVGANGNFTYSSKRLYDEGGYIYDDGTQNMNVEYSVSTYNTTFGIGYVFGHKK